MMKKSSGGGFLGVSVVKTIHLSMQETEVAALIWVDLTCQE